LKYIKYIFICSFLKIISCEANDGVMDISTGGLTLSKENNISMNSEVLVISKTKISVSYEFENKSNKEIEVVIGFPIPPYGTWEPALGEPFPPNFDDFTVFVEGEKITYSKEVKAVVENGDDLTSFFKSRNIDYPNFGGFNYEIFESGKIKEFPAYQINKLKNEDRKFLMSKNALTKDGFPLWLKKVTYYWTQKFPPQKVVHISHSYSPYIGHSIGNTAYEKPFEYERAGGACLDKSLDKTLRHYMTNEGKGYIEYSWTRYILQTANSWKSPIQNFKLILKKEPSEKTSKQYLSLCWNGKFNKLSDTEFVSEIKDFVPDKDILVYWYELK